MIDGKWETDEKDGVMTLFHGSGFILQIFCDVGEFVIYVNGEKFCSYRYRIPRSSVTALQINGDINLQIGSGLELLLIVYCV